MTGNMKIRKCGAALPAAVLLLSGLMVSPDLRAQSYSHARIVRLSFVQGTVSVTRPGVAEWSTAPVNTPIQEGFKVATAANSFAEIEFENGSTARLGEQSELDFTQLALAPNGGKINRMTMAAGYATFDVIPETGDVYTVTAGRAVLAPSGRTIFRVDLNSSAQRIEVFRGVVNVSSPFGSGQLTKNDVLEIDPTTRAYVVTHGITQDAWDRWVEKRDQVLLAEKSRAVPAGLSSYSSAYSGLYGWNDLSYYGNWSDIPGYGYGWSPYMSAGWMPFSFGQWAWYPGFGWTWIDYDPWGWLPFHYGNWAFMSGFGWTWFPGAFGYWSPANVTWFQGDGWIGWSPGVGGTSANGNSLIAIVTNSFRRGWPINPGNVLREPPRLGRRVVAPNVAPTVSAYLPGRVTAAPNLRTLTITGRPSPMIRGNERGNVASNLPSTRLASGAHTLVIGRRPGARLGVPAPTVVLPRVTAFAGTKVSGRTPTGIVFNSNTGQFVNNPNAASPMARGRQTVTMEPGGHVIVESPKRGTEIAPRAGMNRTLSTSPSVAPTTRRQGWFTRLFGGRSAPKNIGATSSGSGAGRQMRLGQPMSAPRGGQAAPRMQTRPSFGHSAGSPSHGAFGGGGMHESAPRMSGGGFGGGGGGHMGGGAPQMGGGGVHSAPAASGGRPR